MAAKVTASKKTAAKRPSRPRVPAPVAPVPVEEPSEDGFEVLRLTTKTARVDEARVPLFYIDDTMYSVLKQPGVNVGLQCLHLYRTRGEAEATDYVLDKLLGPEGYAALLAYDGLTPEQFKQICQVAFKIALGSLELPKE